MGRLVTAGMKFFVLAVAMVVFMVINQGVARADTVTIHGITLGSFSGGFSSNPTLAGLTFNGTSFPNPIGTVNTDTASFLLSSPTVNLGSVTLTGAPAIYTGNTFSLQLTFTFLSAPITLTGNSQPSFVASLIGTVQSAADGSLTIDFNNSPSVFTVLLNGNLISTFSITVSDIIIQPGQTVNIVGNAAAVPEPATLLLLGSGLAGVGAAIKRRRKVT